MSSLNPAWLIAEAVATELTAAFANPTAILADADFGTFSPQSIAVIAPGAEENRPGIGARSWVNIYVPEDTPMTWETGNSYLAKPNIRVSVFVEETKRLRSSLHETCLSLSHFITVCLTRSTLNNVARRAPRQTGSTTHKQKGETQTWVSELRLEYEYQGRGAPVDWAKTVPNCATLTEAAATAAITAAGLTPDSDGAFSSTVAKGIVISQSPAAGTAAYAGDVVTITVSFGKEYTAEVPVVAGLTQAAATTALTNAGLTLGTVTTSMTNDTAAGLVSASNPAAGTGVVAGSTVDLTVSLGDRHYEIPFYGYLGTDQGRPYRITPTGIFQWRLPDGTLQRDDHPTYVVPQGTKESVYHLVMDDGHTVDELKVFSPSYMGGYPGCRLHCEDLIHLRPDVFRITQVIVSAGDIGLLGDLVGAITSNYLYIDGQYGAKYEVYGDISQWPSLSSGITRIYIDDTAAIYGSLKFVAGNTQSFISFAFSTGFSYADIAQTIINWDNCNAASFARTGNFNQYKRSLIEAANSAAEAAIVSLIAKGCSFTFLKE